jgi:hypothetical protein
MEARTSHHNEAFERDGAPRAFYRPLLEAMEDLGPEALAEKRARAGERLGELGATFPLPDAGGEEDRVLLAPCSQASHRKGVEPAQLSPNNGGGGWSEVQDRERVSERGFDMHGGERTR